MYRVRVAAPYCSNDTSGYTSSQRVKQSSDNGECSVQYFAGIISQERNGWRVFRRLQKTKTGKDVTWRSSSFQTRAVDTTSIGEAVKMPVWNLIMLYAWTSLSIYTVQYRTVPLMRSVHRILQKRMRLTKMAMLRSGWYFTPSGQQCLCKVMTY